MSTIALQNSVRCFCSFVAKRTNTNIYVCGRYESPVNVCIFHLHEENLENYKQKKGFPLAFDCEQCLATLKIFTKEYIAPCPMPLIRCGCGSMATFDQVKKDNSNCNKYFFGCSNWRIDEKNCRYFCWSNEYRTKRDLEILNQILNINEVKDNNEELRSRYECVICLSNERNHVIVPCYHLCCCFICSTQIQDRCPLCRGQINSIQRVFLS